MHEISRKMCQIATEMGYQYSLNGRELTYEEVFADTGLLPAMSRRADQLSSLCLGYGLGLTFDEAEGTTLGMKVIFDDITPNVIRLMCLTDVLCELTQAAPEGGIAVLDELMYD